MGIRQRICHLTATASKCRKPTVIHCWSAALSGCCCHSANPSSILWLNGQCNALFTVHSAQPTFACKGLQQDALLACCTCCPTASPVSILHTIPASSTKVADGWRRTESAKEANGGWTKDLLLDSSSQSVQQTTVHPLLKTFWKQRQVGQYAQRTIS